MTNSEQAIREFAQTLIERVWETGNADSHECNTRFDDLRNLQNCVDNNLDDAVEKLTALISEHYVERELYEAEKELNTLLHEAMITAEKRGHDKAMEAISEHYYSREFLLWFHDNVQIESQEETFLVYNDIRFYTLNEVRDFWQRVQEKKEYIKRKENER